MAERAKILEKWGIDYLIIEEFTPQFSSLSPYSFIKDYLVGYLNVLEIVVGYDYSFGRGERTPEELLRWNKKFRYHVEIMPPVMIGGEVVSSSLIRRLISKGDVTGASFYLGDYFSRTGRVIHGEDAAGIWGIPPLIWIYLPRLLLPENGVYLTLAYAERKNIFH